MTTQWAWSNVAALLCDGFLAIVLHFDFILIAFLLRTCLMRRKHAEN
jgi:hypothetical protein